ncbi:MAG: YidC/Oxa1 family membrane protein insertase [Meiothermus sp.]|nr:YidC/Oxa1 family membrane protein insertase [Meiothermus sp.]
MRKWFWLVVLAFSLSPAFALNPEWRQVDVNGDNVQERVAVTNLADIAFDENTGQIVAWYIKIQRARDFRGNYVNQPNLVRSTPPAQGAPNPPRFVPVPVGVLSGFTPQSAEFSGGNPSAPDYNRDGDLVARFTQGETSLTYKIHPRFLTIDVSVQSPTPRTLSWSGLGAGSRTIPKLLTSGNSQPQENGSGVASYAALHNPVAGFSFVPGGSYAFVVRPDRPTQISLNTVNGLSAIEIAVPAGGFNTRVYGGFYELVRLHVEGFYGSLPGLFNPNIWGQVSLGLIWVLEQTYRLVGNSWILAIVVVTLLLRLLMWPLMHRQYKSMAEMQKIQPIVKKIQEKYKDDRQKQQEEMMKVYQEHKINPLGGCFPLLLQMPILFLIYKIMVGYEFGQGFLWIRDLALPDPIYILPVIYILVLLGSTWLSAAGNPEALRQGIIINLVFAFLLFSFPAGVTIYWVLSTAISLGQQWLINKSLGLPLSPAKAAK